MSLLAVLGGLALGSVLVGACLQRGNPYESATPAEVARFKKLPLPLPPGTRTRVRQGAFGRSSHHEAGNEYSWDFEVPLGTPVLAVGDGEIVDVYTPAGGAGGCDPRLAASAHNVKLKLGDGAIAQYVHVESLVRRGDRVTRGQVIARTANNGWLCYPHLHFGVYASQRNLYASPDRRTLPIAFEGVPGGIVREGERYLVPAGPTAAG